MKPKILLVDDEENILKQVRWALEADYDVFTTSAESEAMSIFEKESPPVVTLDLSLNPHDTTDLGGMRLLEQILFHEPSTRAIVITGTDDDKNALAAVRLGADRPRLVELAQVRVHSGRLIRWPPVNRLDP